MKITLAACLMLFLWSCRGLPEEKPNDAAAQHAHQMDLIRRHLDNGDIQRAQNALQGALKSGYEHPMAFFLQGRIHCAAGTQAGYAASIPWFEKAISASPAWIETALVISTSLHPRRTSHSGHDNYLKKLTHSSQTAPLVPMD